MDKDFPKHYKKKRSSFGVEAFNSTQRQPHDLLHRINYIFKG